MASSLVEIDAQQPAEGQFAAGTPQHCFSTDTIPSQQPLGSAEWLSSAAVLGAMAPHWLFTAAWTTGVAHGNSTDSAAEDWTISTSSMTQELSSADDAGQGMVCSSSALPGDCSDPLVCTAQELVAAAAASATPGVHAPRADSAALLNSGAVLLLGQGSTTICGTNTAPVAEALSQQDTCAGPGVLNQHATLQEDGPSGQVLLPAQQQQQQTASRAPAGIRAAGTTRVGPLRRPARRRQGLLLDSQAGMQQLVGAAMDALPSGRSAAPGKPAAASALQRGDRHQLHQGDQHEEQHHHPTSAARQDPACSSASSHSQLVLSGLQHMPMRAAAPEGDSQSVPASGDVLVLGVDSSTGVAGANAAARASAAAAQGEAEQHAASSRAAAAAAPAPAPVLQLLSCSSLNSNPPACRSNSSLFQINLSNCSFLRLGSNSTQNSSFTSHDGSLPQSRQGSFTGQHPGTAMLSPAGGLGLAAVAPASRPTPLPMLHESCSWGTNLNKADRQAAVQGQQQQGANVRRQHPGAPVQQHKQHEQLYYLLD